MLASAVDVVACRSKGLEIPPASDGDVVAQAVLLHEGPVARSQLVSAIECHLNHLESIIKKHVKPIGFEVSKAQSSSKHDLQVLFQAAQGDSEKVAIRIHGVEPVGGLVDGDRDHVAPGHAIR